MHLTMQCVGGLVKNFRNTSQQLLGFEIPSLFKIFLSERYIERQDQHIINHTRWDGVDGVVLPLGVSDEILNEPFAWLQSRIAVALGSQPVRCSAQ